MKVCFTIIAACLVLLALWLFRSGASVQETQQKPAIVQEEPQTTQSEEILSAEIDHTDLATPQNAPRFKPDPQSSSVTVVPQAASFQAAFEAVPKLKPEAFMLAQGGYLAPEDYDAQVKALEVAKSDASSLQFAPHDQQTLEASLVRQSRITQPTINAAEPSLKFQVPTSTHQLNLSPASQ
jgi:hypothetical protein